MGFLAGFDFIAAAMFFTWVYPPPKKKLNRCQVGKQPINHKLTADQASHSLHHSWSDKRRFAARAPLRTARSCRNKMRRKKSTFAGAMSKQASGQIKFEKLFNTHWPKMHLLWCSHTQDQVPNSIAPSGRSSTNEPLCIGQHGIGESCRVQGIHARPFPVCMYLQRQQKIGSFVFLARKGRLRPTRATYKKLSFMNIIIS